MISPFGVDLEVYDIGLGLEKNSLACTAEGFTSTRHKMVQLGQVVGTGSCQPVSQVSGRGTPQNTPRASVTAIVPQKNSAAIPATVTSGDLSSLSASLTP